MPCVSIESGILTAEQNSTISTFLSYTEIVDLYSNIYFSILV